MDVSTAAKLVFCQNDSEFVSSDVKLLKPDA